MPSFSASKQKIKQTKSQNSFSTLSQSTAGQSTKKTIESQQINLCQPQNISQNKILFSLPYTVEINNIITRLSAVFSQELIHVQEDNKGGKILLNGIKSSNKKRYFINFLDCLGLFCLKYGLNGGSLYDTYNLIAISIRKQILKNRCIVNIEYQKYDQQNKTIFMNEIVNKIKDQLKKIDINQDFSTQKPLISRYLASDSIFLQQVQVKQKIFNIFVYQKDKRWDRFRRLFRKSEQTIRQKIQKYQMDQSTKSNQKQTSNKKTFTKTKNPSQLTQAIIFQSQSLFKTLINYYQKQVQDQIDIKIFKSLLTTIGQRQMTLFAIQQILSAPFLNDIFECYLKCTQQQCNLFNKNAKQINQKATNIACFDYLQLRDKYRIESVKNPYHPSIQQLKMIVNATSPRKLLLNIQKVFSSVKIDCLKASVGKVELSSMDDLLPVMIFVTVRAAVNNFPAYVKMIDDYVRLKNQFQLEQRIITTLYVAVQDITKKWNI